MISEKLSFRQLILFIYVGIALIVGLIATMSMTAYMKSRFIAAEEQNISRNLNVWLGVLREELIRGNYPKVYLLCKEYVDEAEIVNLVLEQSDGEMIYGYDASKTAGYNNSKPFELRKTLYYSHEQQEVLARINVIYDMTYAESSVIEMRKWMMLAFAVIVLLQLIAIFFAARLLTSPMSRLSVILNRYDPEREKCPAYVGQKDGLRCKDIDDLYAAYNNMARIIGEYKKRIAEDATMAAVGVMSSHIAHDMRTPLSVIQSYVIASAPSNEDDMLFKEAAERSVGKLEMMANDLLDYAKADRLERGEKNVQEILHKDVLPTVRKSSYNVMIDIDIAEDIVAHIDARRIERVLYNMINNSIYACGESGNVVLSVFRKNKNDLCVIITDDGSGIPAEKLPHIYGLFYSSGKSRGTGLGLAYCKQVVEAHGGKIEVESEVGKGTTFRIIIPNAVVDAPSDLQEKPDRILTKATALTVPVDGKGFAVIDDDEDIREQWRRIIDEKGGRIVCSAATVSEAKSAVTGDGVAPDGTTIDTAIVDYHFEGDHETGIDLIAYLKKRGIKHVHLCTGFFDDEDICRRARDAGADSVIPKPIDEKVVGVLFS